MVTTEMIPKSNIWFMWCFSYATENCAHISGVFYSLSLMSGQFDSRVGQKHPVCVSLKPLSYIREETLPMGSQLLSVPVELGLTCHGNMD